MEEKKEIYEAAHDLIRECEFWIKIGTNINPKKVERLSKVVIQLENELGYND